MRRRRAAVGVARAGVLTPVMVVPAFILRIKSVGVLPVIPLAARGSVAGAVSVMHKSAREPCPKSGILEQTPYAYVDAVYIKDGRALPGSESQPALLINNRRAGRAPSARLVRAVAAYPNGEAGRQLASLSTSTSGVRASAFVAKQGTSSREAVAPRPTIE